MGNLLEDICGFYKAIDQDILRLYSKGAKLWEEKTGVSKYAVSTALGLIVYSFMEEMFIGGLKPKHSIDPFGKPIAVSPAECMNSGLLLIPAATDTVQNFVGLVSGEHPTGVTRDGDRFVIESRALYLLTEINRSSRLAFSLSGLALLGKGVYEIADSIFTGDATLAAQAPWDMYHGMILFFLGSSIYIKDTDPKMLDKEPNIQIWYESLKSTMQQAFGRMAPQPGAEQITNNRTTYQ